MVIDEPRLEKALNDIEEFRQVISLPVNEHDTSTVRHQLAVLHNALPAAILAKETVNYFLVKQQGEQVMLLKDELFGIGERIKVIEAKSNTYMFYHNWASGMINEAHHQITILTLLLNSSKP